MALTPYCFRVRPRNVTPPPSQQPGQTQPAPLFNSDSSTFAPTPAMASSAAPVEEKPVHVDQHMRRKPARKPATARKPAPKKKR